MKALTVTGREQIELSDVLIPSLKPDEILCRVVCCGICGTDIAIYNGETTLIRDGLIKYPVRIGHEWSGQVARVGSGVTGFKPGDRVVADNGITCRQCAACISGDINGCENIKSVGTVNCWDGSFAEYIVIPQCHLFHLPDDISYENGATIEPLTVAYAGIIKRKITSDTIVAVIGTGAIASAAVALAKTLGAGKIIAVGRNETKLQRLKLLGADETVNNVKTDAGEEVFRLTVGHGADFVLETSGAPPTVEQAIDVASNGADLSMIGFYESEIPSLTFNRFVTKKLVMHGIMGGLGLVPIITDFMSRTGLTLESMITRRIDFEQAPEYFRRNRELHAQDIKVIVNIGKE